MRTCRLRANKAHAIAILVKKHPPPHVHFAFLNFCEKIMVIFLQL
jgi:hypothetical protein